MADKTRFFKPGLKSPDFETEEQLATEQTLGRIKTKLDNPLATKGIIKSVGVRKVLIAAADYAAEDVLSENATTGNSWAFNGVVLQKGGSGYITKAQALCSTTALTPRLTLYLFTAVPTSALADNGANTAVLAADVAKYVGKIDFPAMEDLGGFSETLVSPSTTGNLPLGFTCAGDSDTLYGILVTRDAIAGEAALMTMTVILGIEQY